MTISTNSSMVAFCGFAAQFSDYIPPQKRSVR
jgi:hypothetical protein